MLRPAISIFTLWILCIACCAAFGQGSRGSLQGTVRDPSGAIAAAASVTITNIETNVTQQSQTNRDGLYDFPNLIPDTYSVKVVAQGFEPVQRNGITVTVGQAAVVDVSLSLQNVQQSVLVSAGAPLVESSNSTISSVVVGKQIQNLPLNGRDFTTLAEVQPGVVVNGSGVASSFGGKEANFLVNGQIDDATLFLLDGSDISDLDFGYSPKDASGQFIGLDAVQEFRILTSNYSAEFGRNPGGVVEIVTKSGTNELHGTAYDFLRNSAFDAKNYFDLATSPIPAFKRNQFGAALGGPIRKNSMFFFGNYEGLREGLGVTSVSTVPDAAARTGHLPSATVTVDPNVVPFLNLYPLPNGADHGDGTATYTTSATNPINSDLGVGRIDWSPRQSDSIFGRVYIDQSNATSPFASVPVPGFPASIRHNFFFVTLGESHTFTPNLVNSFSFAYNRTNQALTLPLSGSGVPTIALSAGKPLGLITIAGLSSLGNNTIYPIGGVQNLYHVQDELSWVRGKHELKMGGELRRFQINDFFDVDVNGQYTFNGLQSFLTGAAATYTGVEPGGTSDRHWRWASIGGFVQDDYHLRRNLILNLGVRYELNTVPTEINGKLSNLRFPTDTAVTVGSPLFSPIHDLVDPRVGFAWQAHPLTVLRGGFGLFRDQIVVNVFGNTRLSPPFLVGAFATNPPFPNPNLGTITPGTLSIQNIYYNVQQPTVEQWNLQLQQQLSPTSVFKLGYIGNRGLHLVRALEANSALPEILPDGQKYFPANSVRRNSHFGPVRERKTDGLSWYNSMQVEVDQQLYKGLVFQLSYTFSRAEDTNASSFSNFPNNPSNTQDPDDFRADKALSPFDQRNRVVVSGVYDLPYGHGRAYGAHAPVLLNSVVGDWRFSGIYSYASGEPFTISDGFNRSQNLQTGTAIGDRPNHNPNFTGPVILGKPSEWFNPNAFALQPAGFYGNVGRNSLIGPTLGDFDFSADKVFPLHESWTLELRGDFFNLTNHPNFATPTNATSYAAGGGDVVFANATGVPAGNAGQIFSTTTTSRQIQVSLRLSF
jgi:hypothetical protein